MKLRRWPDDRDLFAPIRGRTEGLASLTQMRGLAGSHGSFLSLSRLCSAWILRSCQLFGLDIISLFPFLRLTSLFSCRTCSFFITHFFWVISLNRNISYCRQGLVSLIRIQAEPWIGTTPRIDSLVSRQVLALRIEGHFRQYGLGGLIWLPGVSWFIYRRSAAEHQAKVIELAVSACECSASKCLPEAWILILDMGQIQVVWMLRYRIFSLGFVWWGRDWRWLLKKLPLHHIILWLLDGSNPERAWVFEIIHPLLLTERSLL